MHAERTLADARVLVTGGTGFLGRYVVQKLRERRCRVRVLARGSKPKTAFDDVELARGDLRDAHAVRSACDGVDAVVHAGALSQPWGRAAEFEAINVAGTRNVLDACRAAGVQRLVHVSSPSVAFTGDDQHELGDDVPFAARCLSTYSRTKQAAELLVASSNVPAVIVRPKALFGPGDRSLLPRLVGLARSRRLVQIGDGTNEVDLTYVENASDAIVAALSSERALGRTYHVTNGEHVRVWDAIRALVRGLGFDAELRRVPYRAAWTFAAGLELRARLFGGEPRLTRYTVAVLARTQTYDIRGARRDLGYVPRISVAEGIARTLRAWRTEARDG
jgi:2-alkyl-3-oxoalkanoate reductase